MRFLLNSKLKQRLFGYVFTHENKDFYVRELASLIGEDPGNLSRELKRLERDGLFRSVSRGRSKFYSLNKDHSLFPELKKMVFKTEGVSGSLKGIVERYDGIVLCFIHGSYAREEEKEGSDIDLIVVGEFPRSSFTRDIRALETKLGREINFSSYALKEFDKEVKKQGSFLYLVIKERTVVLKGSLCAG